MTMLLSYRLNTEMLDGNANARKLLIDDLVETRQKYVIVCQCWAQDGRLSRFG